MQQIISDQQVAMQKLKADFESDKLVWNKQHHEDLLNMEQLYSSRIKSLEDEVLDTKRENEQFRVENSRLETELISQQRVILPLVLLVYNCYFAIIIH